MWLNTLLVRHSAKTLQLVGGSQYPGTVVTSCRLLFSWLQNRVSPWLLKLACVVLFTCTNKQNKTGRLCHLISYFCENTADDTSHLIILQVTVTAAAAASRAAAAICAAITSNYERASAVKMKIPPVCRSLFRF